MTHFIIIFDRNNNNGLFVIVSIPGPLCDFTNCPYDRFCVVDKRNRPTCVCSQSCNFFPTSEVCGTDNKTYSNECFLTVAACMTNKTIAVLSYQPCAEGKKFRASLCSSYLMFVGEY